MKTLATKKEIKILAVKAKIKAEQDKMVKGQRYDLSLFIGQSYFNYDGVQLYLIFQPIDKRQFTKLTSPISEWESMGF